MRAAEDPELLSVVMAYQRDVFGDPTYTGVPIGPDEVRLSAARSDPDAEVARLTSDKEISALPSLDRKAKRR